MAASRPAPAASCATEALTADVTETKVRSISPESRGTTVIGRTLCHETSACSGSDRDRARPAAADSGSDLAIGAHRRGASRHSGPDAGGLFEMSGRNVVVPGDTLSIWVDPRTRQGRKVQVSTTFDGDRVSLTATFKTLPSGLNHVAYAEVTVPTRQISIQVQNF